jgi:hypothetical protein
VTGFVVVESLVAGNDPQQGKMGAKIEFRSEKAPEADMYPVWLEVFIDRLDTLGDIRPGTRFKVELTRLDGK